MKGGAKMGALYTPNVYHGSVSGIRQYPTQVPKNSMNSMESDLYNFAITTPVVATSPIDSSKLLNMYMIGYYDELRIAFYNGGCWINTTTLVTNPVYTRVDDYVDYVLFLGIDARIPANTRYNYAYTSYFNNMLYADSDSARQAILFSYPITYRLTNCTAPFAPTEAVVGDVVNVPLVMQEGYDIITPSTDILVTNNGVTVPHTYSNGTVSFTMPNPS